MPKILEDRRQAIARNNPNLSKSSTYAIATSALQKEGKMPGRKFQGGGFLGSMAAGISSGMGDDTPSPRAKTAKTPAVKAATGPPTNLFPDPAGAATNAAAAADTIGAGTGQTYRRGGKVAFCKGGKVISSRSW